MSCAICCEDYTGKKYAQKSCPFCQFESCQQCVQTYLLGTTKEPHCMNCRRGWEVEHLEQMVSKSFRLNDYKKHRENSLLDIEKSLLPQTQEHVKTTLNIRGLEAMNKELKQTYDTIKKEYYQLPWENRQLNRDLSNAYKEENEALIEEFEAKIQENNQKSSQFSTRMYEIKATLYENRNTLQELKRMLNGNERLSVRVQSKSAFTIRCSKENCKGFIGGNNVWKCGVCESYACEKCHEFIGEQEDPTHECKPDQVETAKMLKKEAKSCPGCSTLIYKISGCSQMWCTQCHTAFNWNTGQIEKGVVHNPHFYEYQRAHTRHTVRNLNDEPCGGYVTIRQLSREMKQYYSQEIRDRLFDLHRTLVHIQHEELPRYNVQFFVNTNQQMRIEYLLNELSEEDFKWKLQIKEKRNHKRRDIYLILDMYVQTLHDLFRNLIGTKTTKETYIDIFDAWFHQVRELMDYGNRCFEKVSKRYNCVVPYLRSDHYDTIHYGK